MDQDSTPLHKINADLVSSLVIENEGSVSKKPPIPTILNVADLEDARSEAIPYSRYAYGLGVNDDGPETDGKNITSPRSVLFSSAEGQDESNSNNKLPSMPSIHHHPSAIEETGGDSSDLPFKLLHDAIDLSTDDHDLTQPKGMKKCATSSTSVVAQSKFVGGERCNPTTTATGSSPVVEVSCVSSPGEDSLSSPSFSSSCSSSLFVNGMTENASKCFETLRAEKEQQQKENIPLLKVKAKKNPKKKKKKAQDASLTKSIRLPKVYVKAQDPSKQQMVLDYLSTIHDKLPLRVKTHVQLTIYNQDDENDSFQLVVSGNTTLRQLGQLLTILTSSSSSPKLEDQHPRGKRKQQRYSLKKTSSWFSLLIGDDTGTNIGDGSSNRALKHSCSQNEEMLIGDKSIKIVQIFQGLVMSPNSGMVWDSDQAAGMATYYDSLTWNLASMTQQSEQISKTYYVVIDGVIADQCILHYKNCPLPRLVDENCFGNRRKAMMELNEKLFQHYSKDNGVGRRSETDNGNNIDHYAFSDDHYSFRLLDPICYADGTVYGNTTKPFKKNFSESNVYSAGAPNNQQHSNPDAENARNATSSNDDDNTKTNKYSTET